MRAKPSRDTAMELEGNRYTVLTLTSLGRDVLAGELNLHVAQAK
jgi:hypothetical protein